jgi:tetratricopeptide (TPR) repeat protein
MSRGRVSASRWRGLCVSGLTVLLAACGSVPLRPATLVTREAVELTATPFFAQREHQCGPAALAMVANTQGVTTTADALTPLLLVPAKAGTLQVELAAQTRALGLVAHRHEGGFPGLVAELDAGHPVIVLQNNGLGWYPVWHYAVVIGYQPADDSVVLRSGVTERRVVARRTFERTWARSGRWGLVVLAPGRLPANASAGSYTASVAALERQSPAAAARAYAAGVERWPLAWELPFAQGNQAAAAGQHERAADLLAHAATLAPVEGVIWNNLATVYLSAGRLDEAEAAAREAVARGGALQAAFEATLREVEAARRD